MGENQELWTRTRARALIPVLAWWLGAAWAAGAGEKAVPGESRPAIEKVVSAYTKLYTRATLDQWRMLFHPSLAVAHPAADGTIRIRHLEEFFAAQKAYFETGRQISERLENLQINQGRRIARVNADFVLVDERIERRGKLGLHLAEGNDGWKIVTILFSYDKP